MAFDWLRAFRSRAFGDAVRFWLVILVSNLTLLSIAFGFFSHQYVVELRSEYAREVEKMVSLYENRGLAALEDRVAQGWAEGVPPKFSFILVDSQDNKLAGNLDTWKAAYDVDQSWFGVLFRLRTPAEETASSIEYMSTERRLEDGSRLQLVRYVGNSRQAMRRIIRALSIAMMISIVTSIVVISIGSASFLRRLEPINRDIDIVMKGDLTHRLTVAEQRTELDRLAVHINDMLDRIQELMEGVKQVSDNIAHDLRTPLTRLRNNLALYERNCVADDRSAIRSLIDEADHLIVTFNALLRIARIELGETRSKLTSIHFDQLIEEVIDLYEPVASEKQITLTTSMDACQIAGDRDLIFQAIANILDNAIKYTPVAGHISIGLHQGSAEDEAGKRVILSVNDSGRGVKEENLNKVFERFYREDSSRGKEPGNGLGLSLVAAVVKMHRGVIKLQNTSPGLLVTVNFPVDHSDVSSTNPAA